MIIGGIQKNSFIDYPGKISTVIFLSGCNFTCPYCHNLALAQNTPPCIIPEKDALDFLERRRHLIEGVVLSGGEPTLEPKLLSLCRRIKAMGYRLKLDTNGSRPAVLEMLIREEILDYVAMDIKTDLAGYSRLWPRKNGGDIIQRSVRMLLAGSIPFEFRTTCVPPFVTVENAEEIGRLIAGAPRYYLQKDSRHDVINPPASAYAHSCRIDLEKLKTILSPYVVSCSIR